MEGFKQVQVSTEKGTVLAYEPIVLSFPSRRSRERWSTGPPATTRGNPSHSQ